MDGSQQPPALPAGQNVGLLIDKYIQVRDRLEAWKTSQKEQAGKFAEALKFLEGNIMLALNQAGVESMKGKAGTVFKQTRVSATVEKGEWDKVLEYIIEKQAWDLLEARVSKNAVMAVIEETGQPVPGVKVSQETVLHVRRS